MVISVNLMYIRKNDTTSEDSQDDDSEVTFGLGSKLCKL